jgi:capsid assembly protease
MSNAVFSASALTGQMLAVHPAQAQLAATQLELRRIKAGAFERESFTKNNGGYDVLAGVAIIPITGIIVQRLGCLRPYWGMVGCDGIRQNFLTSLHDPAVQAIMLDIDSPGGEVSGVFDLVEEIYQARGIKPIHAVLNENAFSAAYALASAADRITVPRTGGTGSIGVIAAFLDYSAMLEQAGVKITFIHYGARKTDGRPELPLSPEAQARFQADIDAVGELFVATVARNRNLSTDAVRAMQATTFLGAQGLAAGLADAIMPPDAAFRALLSQIT